MLLWVSLMFFSFLLMLFRTFYIKEKVLRVAFLCCFLVLFGRRKNGEKKKQITDVIQNKRDGEEKEKERKRKTH